MKKKTVAVLVICALVFVMSGAAWAPSEADSGAIVDEALGRIEDGAYINDYFELTFAPPEEWRFYSEEELAQMMDITMEIIEDDQVRDLIRESLENGGVTNMAAVEGTGGNNINMRLMKNDMTALLREFDEAFILEMIQDTVEEQLTAAGYRDLELDIREIEFAGEKKSALFISGTFYDIPVYQAEILLMGEEYYSIVTFTSIMEDQLEEQFVYWRVTEEPEAERVKEASGP